jgi:microcystin-dependent protein
MTTYNPPREQVPIFDSSLFSDTNGDNATSTTSGSLTTGMVLAYAGKTTPPTGWLFCDGSAISRTNYASLFSVIGITYGNGDGTTTFNLPPLMSGNISYGTFPAGSATSANTGFIVDGGANNIVYNPSVVGGSQKISSVATAPHTHTLTFGTANYVNSVNSTNNTGSGDSLTRLVSSSSSAFPTATDNVIYGNLQSQADFVPRYVAFCWIIKY